MASVLSAILWLIAAVSLFLGWVISRRERRDRSTLFLMIAAVGVAGHLLTAEAWRAVWPGAPGWWTAPFAATSVILYALLAIVFNMYYFCVYNESPSNMIMHVVRHSPGVSPDEVAARVDARALVTVRLRQLIDDGHVSEVGSRYRVRPSGRVIVTALAVYRRVLGWQVGG